MMTRPSILLVEDDDDVSSMLVEILLTADYDVDLARNGAEGLLRLGRGPTPKVILLDWSMPVMNGPEMFTAMQSHSALRDIPVVLLTAHSDAKSKAIALRASGYLKKPIDADDLLRMVSTIVREHSMLRLRVTRPTGFDEKPTGTLPAVRNGPR